MAVGEYVITNTETNNYNIEEVFIPNSPENIVTPFSPDFNYEPIEGMKNLDSTFLNAIGLGMEKVQIDGVDLPKEK